MMASESSRLCCCSCQNFSSGNTPPSPRAILSCNPSPDPALVLALVATLVPDPTLTLIINNELFKKFIKAYLVSNQRLQQSSAECKQTFRAKVLELYYNKLYLDC